MALYQPLEVHDPFNSESQRLLLGCAGSAVLLVLVFVSLHKITLSCRYPFGRSPNTHPRKNSDVETQPSHHHHTQQQKIETTTFPICWESTLEQIGIDYTGKVLEDTFEQSRILKNANNSLRDDVAHQTMVAESAEKARKELEVEVEVADKARKDADDKTKKEADKAKQASAKSNSALATKDNIINKQKSQIADLEGRNTDLSQQIDERKDSAVTYRETIADQEGQISTQATQITQLTNEAGKKTAVIKAKVSANSALLTENTTLRGSLNRAHIGTNELEGQIKRQKSNAEEARSKTKKASDEELRRQLEEQKKKSADQLHAKASELAAVQAQLDTEKAASADAQRMHGEAEKRVEDFIGQVADLLTQNNDLRAQLDNQEKQETSGKEEENKEVEHSDPEEVDNPTVGSSCLKYNRKKIRCNKRPDGSIYTSKHPRSTPPRLQKVAEKGQAGVQRPGPLHEWQDEQSKRVGEDVKPAETEQADTQKDDQSSKQVRRLCTFYQEGHCKFGAKCFNIHEAPAGQESPSKASEEPIPQVSTPASVQQADERRDDRIPIPELVKPVCQFFIRGKCRFGANCLESHDLSVSPKNLPQRPEGMKHQLLGDRIPSYARKLGSKSG